MFSSIVIVVAVVSPSFVCCDCSMNQRTNFSEREEDFWAIHRRIPPQTHLCCFDFGDVVERAQGEFELPIREAARKARQSQAKMELTRRHLSMSYCSTRKKKTIVVDAADQTLFCFLEKKDEYIYCTREREKKTRKFYFVF